MIHLARGRVISWRATEGPASCAFSAIDDATYDGAPDAGRKAHCQGFGATPEAAICDLFEQLEAEGVVEPLPPPVTFSNGLGGLFVEKPVGYCRTLGHWNLHGKGETCVDWQTKPHVETERAAGRKAEQQ